MVKVDHEIEVNPLSVWKEDDDFFFKWKWFFFLLSQKKDVKSVISFFSIFCHFVAFPLKQRN